MIWHKDFNYNYHKNIDYLISVMIFLTIFGLIFNRPILMVVIGLFATYLFINIIYDRKIGEKLKLVNPRQSIRLFPGEEGILLFEFENRDIFPYVNGHFKCQIDHIVKPQNYIASTNKNWINLKIPLSVIRKGKTFVKLPVRAETRGTAHVKNISYQVPHLFNFDSVHLTYQPFYYTEFVVFPKLIPVQGVEHMFQTTPGSQLTNF